MRITGNYTAMRITVPTNTVQVPMTTGTVKDSGSLLTGLLKYSSVVINRGCSLYGPVRY